MERCPRRSALVPKDAKDQVLRSNASVVESVGFLNRVLQRLHDRLREGDLDMGRHVERQGAGDETASCEADREEAVTVVGAVWRAPSV